LQEKEYEMHDTPRLNQTQLRDLLRELGLLTPGAESALTLAREVHGEQQRDDGAPYLNEHVYPVAAAVVRYVAQQGIEGKESAVITALLHDALEDSNSLTLQEIEDRFVRLVAECIGALTKPKKAGDSPEDKAARELRYFEQLAQAPRIAKLVKVFDRLNNLACIHKSPRMDRRGYVDETRMFHLPLAGEIDPALAAAMEGHLRRLERSGEG
jgi:(p)ppGpp synthase/HD superfamily hydrolase